jgi:hypothetical protein
VVVGSEGVERALALALALDEEEVEGEAEVEEISQWSLLKT